MGCRKESGGKRFALSLSGVIRMMRSKKGPWRRRKGSGDVVACRRPSTPGEETGIAVDDTNTYYDPACPLPPLQSPTKAKKVSHNLTAELSDANISLLYPLVLQKVTLSPQQHLERLMLSRGYSIDTFQSLQTGYYNKPSELQIASYHAHLAKVVLRKDTTNDRENVRKMLSCGISLNPCSEFGSSLLQGACRRGRHELLCDMVELGCCLQVADEFGRTPLHETCGASKPALETAKVIIRNDRHQMMLRDVRGFVPLDYIPIKHYEQWIEFLNAHKDEFWPPRDVENEGEEQVPGLFKKGANETMLADPENALPIEIVKKVVSGMVTPEEAGVLAKVSHHLELFESFSFKDSEEDSSAMDDHSCSGNDSYDSDYTSSSDCDDLLVESLISEVSQFISAKTGVSNTAEVFK